MTIKRKFQLVFTGLLLAVGCSCASILAAVWTADEVARVENRRLESLVLADELRQSSDDLTRMARSFVATRDGIFELYFQDILDIRSGEIPYPEGYSGIFWDFMISDNGRLAHDGQSISLKERMRNLGFSEAEFAKLQLAEDNSNDLAILETRAMHAVKGQYDDGTGEFTVFAAPDRELALKLLFGQEYHDAKAKIMRPIQDFFDLLEQRTLKESNEILRLNEVVTRIAFATVLLTLCLVGYAFFMMQKSVISPLVVLKDAIGEFRVTREAIDLSSIATGNEIGKIATGLTETTQEVSSYISSINEAREELAQGEQNLRDREERIRELLEVSPIGFILVRMDGTIILTNQAYRNLIGAGDNLTPGQKVGSLYVNPEDRERYLEVLHQEGGVSGYEILQRTIPGEVIWATVSSKIVS